MKQNMNYSIHAQQGQSLGEVVVALGVAVLMAAGLLVGMTVSLRNTESARTRSQAVKFAQEAIEAVRQLRDSDWAEFRGRSGLWCLSESGDWSQASVCPKLATIFTRGVQFSWNNGEARMDVTATVSWNDGNTTHTSELTTFFTQWK